MHFSTTLSIRGQVPSKRALGINKRKATPEFRRAASCAFADASGFSRTDLAVTLLVIAIFSWLLLSWFLPPKARIAKTTCSSNLNYLYLAARNFTEDHTKRFPWQVPAVEGGTMEYNESGSQAYMHFQVLSSDLLVTRSIICPQDQREPARNWPTMVNTNVSYFIDIDGKPSSPMSILAGDRNITAASSVIFRVSQSDRPNWVKSVGLHGDQGHLVFADGHVEELDSVGLSNAVQRTGNTTNRFAVP
jgi:prepilin-type processing-associated H-X9-DG protein